LSEPSPQIRERARGLFRQAQPMQIVVQHGRFTVMSAWVRVVWATAVLVIPGGFLLLMAFLFGRTVHQRYLQLIDSRQGEPISFVEVVAGIHFKDVLREARAM
ncbi:MAG: hypothetical protein ACT4TC_18580, partial [Myxococcaceae bacterium]